MRSLIVTFFKVFVVATVILIICLSSCSGIPIKLIPEYDGVDPRAQEYVNEYLWLSTQNHIRFKNKVTVGFRNITNGSIVGYCTYGTLFREIDIDVSYWNRSTNTTKMTLLFHELSHCYCHRDHDYGEGLEYLESGPNEGGYLEDGCPSSIMYPVVIDDRCVIRHYREYTTEMFDRCSAW